MLSPNCQGVAATVTRYLGARVIIAKSFARIHRTNLISFGVLPLIFTDPTDYDTLAIGDRLNFEDLLSQLNSSNRIHAQVVGRNRDLPFRHELSPRQVELLRVGGLLPQLSERFKGIS